VKIVSMPDLKLPDGSRVKDLSDLVEKLGFTRADIDALIEGAPLWRPPIACDDFYAYMPDHNYIFIPSREPWPATSVNARIPPIEIGKTKDGKLKTLPASDWLDKNRAVEQMIWAPGLPLVILDRLLDEGGWIDRPGIKCLNLYRPPNIKLGDPKNVRPWLRHIKRVYRKKGEARRIVEFFAQRVQYPEIKINHALVLGGEPGIGKDTILEPLKMAVGPWNFKEVAPSSIMGDFNGYINRSSSE
jgi:hypothetical protein